MIDFKGQVVVVTGAGRGLGRAYAREIARRGASVIVNDLGCATSGEGSDPSVADRVVTEIVEEGGVAAPSYDSVATPEGGAAIVEAALSQFGRVDAVISNAGGLNITAFANLSPTDWRRTMSIHLDGAFHVSQPAFRAMKRQGYGRIVFIASSAGIFGQPSVAPYAAAKAGLVGLANVIAIEGAAHGIKANTVLPFAATRMMTELVGEERVAETPYMRAQDPQLVAPVVAYLASRDCAVSQHIYSAGLGRFARVFTGLGEGWGSEPDSEPTVEDIQAHLPDLARTTPFTVPLSIFDEIATICAQRGIPYLPHAAA